MASIKTDELRAQSHKLGKAIAAKRFAIKHAGTGRAGAPAKALTKERKAEIQAEIKELEAERSGIRNQLSNAKDGKQTAVVVGLALVESEKTDD